MENNAQATISRKRKFIWDNEFNEHTRKKRKINVEIITTTVSEMNLNTPKPIISPKTFCNSKIKIFQIETSKQIINDPNINDLIKHHGGDKGKQKNQKKNNSNSNNNNDDQGIIYNVYSIILNKYQY